MPQTKPVAFNVTTEEVPYFWALFVPEVRCQIRTQYGWVESVNNTSTLIHPLKNAS